MTVLIPTVGVGVAGPFGVAVAGVTFDGLLFWALAALGAGAAILVAAEVVSRRRQRRAGWGLGCCPSGRLVTDASDDRQRRARALPLSATIVEPHRPCSGLSAARRTEGF